MRRSHLTCLHVVVLLALVCVTVLAGASATSAIAAQESGVPQLTDRYASINDLTTSKNSDERVIVDTNISVLTSANRALHELPVRFSGEAVGDVLAADEGHKWINVLGASGASIGVYMSDEQAALVANLGNYHTSGSTLEVEGTYSISCGQHQGELDVHATSVRVLDMGGRITHAVDPQRLLLALGLCAVGFALLSTFIVLRRRSLIRAQEEQEKDQ